MAFLWTISAVIVVLGIVYFFLRRQTRRIETRQAPRTYARPNRASTATLAPTTPSRPRAVEASYNERRYEDTTRYDDSDDLVQTVTTVALLDALNRENYRHDSIGEPRPESEYVPVETLPSDVLDEERYRTTASIGGGGYATTGSIGGADDYSPSADDNNYSSLSDDSSSDTSSDDD